MTLLVFNLIILLILYDMQRVLEDRHYKNFVGFQGKARCDGLRKAIQKPAQAGGLVRLVSRVRAEP